MKAQIFIPAPNEIVPNPPRYLKWFCPGCGHCEHASLDHPKGWLFEGTEHNPSLTPSVKNTWEGGGKIRICHVVMKNGILRFCRDSSHSLAGKRVQMIDLTKEQLEA